jgi:hypothetical protein
MRGVSVAHDVVISEDFSELPHRELLASICRGEDVPETSLEMAAAVWIYYFAITAADRLHPGYTL